jgi:hypothetical protein
MSSSNNLFQRNSGPAHTSLENSSDTYLLQVMTSISLQAGAAFLAAISIVGCSRQEAPVATAPVADSLAPPATPSKGVRLLDPAPPAAASPLTTETARTIVKQRSKKKSALIVGGSAAAGAAIGAIAGGGKGAGIGAIAGGVGGLVYDRSTAKKTVPAN